MDIKINRHAKSLISIAATVVMFVFILISYDASADISLRLTVAAFFSLVYLLALLIFTFRKEIDRVSAFLFGALAAAALVYIRVCMLYYPSADYTTFLTNWVARMRELSVIDAIRAPIGDYNMPYMYLLLIIAKLPFDELVMIKFVSCIFDVLLAFSVMLTVGKLTNSKKAALISFVAALALPTVILNGSMWAQCDSIYGFFVVMCFYYILERKGGRAIFMFALAFSFKLQAIFVLPAIIVAIFSGHLKPKKFVWLPIGFLATCLPALIFGRSFANTFMVYINQTQSYEHLDMNCPTVWRLVSNVSFDNFNAAGVMLGGLAAITIIYLGFIKRESIGNKELTIFFALSAIAIVFFLPRMHERYYFLADVLSLILFFSNRKLWFVPAVVVFSSYVAYAYYLFGGITLVKYVYLSLAILTVLGILVSKIYRIPSGTKKVIKNGKA